MRRFATAIVLAAGAFTASPLAAQQEERTTTSILESPLSDVNLKKRHIPPVLIDAQAHPYSTAGMTDCARIGAAVKALDAVLGRDVDVPVTTKRNGNHDLAMDAGQDVMNSLIPGRFIIRRISGAEAAQRRAVAAVFAGSVRRGFLKGIGLSKGCKPPAAPLPPVAPHR
jgi:hypothetical protein